MGEEYGEFPSVQVNLSEEDLTPGPKDHRYVHIDDFAESKARSNSTDEQGESDFESHDERGVELHLYAFEEDRRRDDIIDTMQDLRQDFILATGIIWPDVLRDEVEQADTFRMRALEWAYAVSGHMDIEPDELPRIADQAEEYIEPNDG
jgi:hypothetical protein